MSEPTTAPAGATVPPTAVDLPPGAVDTHVHVFDPARFPYAADTAYRPLAHECGTADDLARVLDAHRVDRVVVVNPTAGYGNDNACMLDALERLGPRARGIARVPLSIAPAELDAMQRRGVVGVRLDVVALGVAPVGDPLFPRFAAALADRDLLLDVQAEGEQWSVVAPALARVPGRIVIDHAGRPAVGAGIDAPAFRALRTLARSERVAFKLSGAMRYSSAPPPYDDVLPFVRAIVAEATPERLVFGSDWPFLRSDRRFDYGPMLAQLARAVPAAADRERILARTAATWFGFS